MNQIEQVANIVFNGIPINSLWRDLTRMVPYERLLAERLDKTSLVAIRYALFNSDTPISTGLSPSGFVGRILNTKLGFVRLDAFNERNEMIAWCREDYSRGDIQPFTRSGLEEQARGFALDLSKNHKKVTLVYSPKFGFRKNNEFYIYSPENPEEPTTIELPIDPISLLAKLAELV